ncbi:hypothetical protein O181_088919 [Austropuccinia psidii MF-1]|uniref:Reverse transcriptase Ty1/copia-type domain-containing protein n=1 Tax=Austropuccinia psidii MF-1 TaxID=1389203 RepID=A0A9Q3ISM8_9BASI|nr:hypothetical protein [Austropuccinia psidii MF-1]
MHVDDGVIFSNDQEAVNKLWIQLTEDLKVKWEDKLTRIVGINVKQEDNKLVLSQTDFARQIIQHFKHKSNSPLLRTLSDLPETKLQTSQGILIEQKWYQSIIGSLNYLALRTRPDLSYAVGYLARYSGSPQQEHWGALKYLLDYLKHTEEKQLIFQLDKINETLDLWSDADWGGEFQ